MKRSNLLKSLLLSMFLALPLVSCETPNSASQQESESNSTSQEESTPSEESSIPEEKVEIITIAEAIEIAKAAGETATTEAYVIKGTIKTVSNAQYGEMTVEDATGSLYVYGVDGYSTLDDKPVAGDLITLSGKLKTYKGTPEMDRGYIVEFEHVSADEQVDLTQYTKATVLEARNAADEAKLKVTGTVAAITYANGLKPNGLYLVDNTSSIYVYSGDIASQVKIGNTIEIAGIKDYYILDSEKTNAAKFGYEGCCQLTNPILISNDKGKTEWDKSWVSETTVKDLIETSVTENITTEIYKVNAYIKKSVETSYINYYINDIDGVTGTYTYTQCDGNDFDWLDEFDGKICTVYVAAHNAKSTASDCFFRLIPISVSYDGYTFDLNDSAEYALKYHANDQFEPSYSADPALELISNVSNDKLGIDNVAISYASSNTSALYFTTENGKTVMHTNNETSSTATVTITATSGTITATSTVEVKVGKIVIAEGSTVKEAIDTQDGSEVQVRAIAGPSVVNKVGFYLIDETGSITVETTVDIMAEINLGDEVVIKGTKNHRQTQNKGIGQCVIENATLVANYYGNNEYSTASFVSGKTIDELYGYDAFVDYSTTVFVVDCVVSVQESDYFTSAKLCDENGKNLMSMYCKDASQYSWLTPYANQVITLEIALCNWNDKSYWAACVLSATVNGEKIYNTLNYND